jgi:hypothetical protein
MGFEYVESFLPFTVFTVTLSGADQSVPSEDRSTDSYKKPSLT